jgi:CMP-N-acetylneuraminic acid synthetase
LGARAKAGELPELVKSNGAITIAKVHRIKEERSYYVYPLAAYLMPWPDGLDVDTEEDLLIAESVFNSRSAVTDSGAG